MVDQLEWLGKKEEVEFSKLKFRGKHAGPAWKYTQNVDGLIRVRAIIFVMAVLVYYPVIINAFYLDLSVRELLLERFVFSVMLLFAGIFFNHFRVGSIFIAAIPLGIILLSYCLDPTHLQIKRIAFLMSILIIVLLGIYNHVRLYKLKKQLEHSLRKNAQALDEEYS